MIREILQETAKQFPQKSAIVFKEQSISFAQLNHNVLCLAHALRQQGVEEGDKIGIYLPNSPAYIYSYLACFCLGAVGVPLDYMLKTEEILSCLTHAETKILIAQENNDADLKIITSALPSLKIILSGDGKERESALSFETLLEETSPQLAPAHIRESDPALIMYTSGTTGAPKGIVLTYKHLEGSPAAMKYFVDLSERDCKLSALPLSHIGGFIYIQNCITFGITLILMERFNPLEFLKNIEQYQVTCFHIVPAMYTAILSLKQIEKFNLSSLRWVVVFGAPSAPEILQRFNQYCPNAKFLNGWGMTETCPPNTVTPLGSNKIESVGKSAPHCDIKIVDEDDREMPTGQVGEIVIRGWIVLKEYYKDPQTTAMTKRNGWFHTGDLGRFDEESFLYIVGRKKEMIKVAGQIVYAPEVEAAFYKHEAVAEVAVIGVTDPLRGEAVKAFIVLKPDSKTSAEDLRYFTKEHLANFKVPQTIEIRESLPKNRTGKIDKALLKQEVLT